MRHVLGIDRAALFARLHDPLDAATLAAYQRLLDERAAGIPVAYLTGTREFMGLPFQVDPEVLIPRPETEILVEWALAWLSRHPHATVVDVGTGSGAIALSLAALAPESWSGRIVASDISQTAVAVAARNCARLGLGERVAFVRGSLLSWLRGPVDLLLANLPYLRADQIAGNPQLAAEPALALAGGQDGLDLIRPLLADAPRLLAAAGALALEIDPGQRETVVRLATAAFGAARIDTLQDLAGHDRHVIVQTASVAERARS